MERSIAMKPFSGSLSQKPIFNAMEPTLPYSSFTQKTSLRERDASFSSYLRPEEAAVQEHVGRIVQEDSEISIFDAQKYFSEGHDQRLSRRVSPVNMNLDQISERCDLSAVVPRFSSASSVDGYGTRNYRARSFHATPTASSEASWNSQTGLLSNPPGAIAVSLRNSSSDGKKGGSTKAKWFFRRKCPCSGKKSVQVLEEKQSESRTPTPSIGSNNSNSKANSLNLNKHIACKPVEKTPERAANHYIKPVKSSSATEWNERRQVIPSSHRFPTATDNHFHSNQQLMGQRVLASGSGFTFPILMNHQSTSSSAELLVLNNGKTPSTTPTVLEDPPRDSLEVFRPNTQEEESISSKSTSDHHHHHHHHHHQLLQLQPPGAARPVDRDCLQSFTFPSSPKYSLMNMNMMITTASATTDVDDLASDASSDLFEIESFSTQTCSTSYPMYPYRRDSLEEVQEASSFNNARRMSSNGNGGAIYCRRSLDEPTTPSIAPTECYEPSEASIDWSVTTAEGFDKASVTNFSVTASEVDDFAVIHEAPKHGGGGGGGKRRGNGLLSCRCEKAVSVGPHPVKWVPSAEGQRVSSTWKHVSSRPGIVNKPPLASSRSARLSLPFAT